LTVSLSEHWERHAADWTRWAREPGHDSYWRFHRDSFLELLPPPGRLSLDGVEIADPYVERLLEGFAFLAARVQLKIEAEFPRFVQHLTEVTCPTLAAPLPSMAIVRLHPDAAAGLVDRKVSAVGIDTPSIDYGQSTTFDVHQRLFAADIPGFENVAHLERLPATGAFLVALPMKIKGGSGGPLRIVALLP